MNNKIKQIPKIELMSPAGNWTMLRAVADAGCNSVYFGLKDEGLNMRQTAGNFSVSELKKVSDFCHKKNIKTYLTLNTIIYEDEIKKIENIIKKAKQAKIDAVICWDMAVVQLCKKHKIPIHLSTQASASNSAALEFYKKQGISRAVLARECTLKQIKQIISQLKKQKIKLEIETFIHGAMCISISGRCFLSQEIFGKSANRGKCLQPCRRQYIIQDPEDKHYLKMGKDYVMSPKDLCALPFTDQLIKAGITAFKIEGRSRSPEYAKTVTECYRKAIDSAQNNKLTPTLKKQLVFKLEKVYNKRFSSGFYLGLPTAKDYAKIYGNAAKTKKIYIGKVRNFFRKNSVAEIRLEAGSVHVGNRLMIQGPTTGVVEFTVNEMEFNHKKIQRSEKGRSFGVLVPKTARENDKVYLVKDNFRKKE